CERWINLRAGPAIRFGSMHQVVLWTRNSSLLVLPNLRSSSVGLQPVGCHQIVGERMPQRHGLGFDQTAHRKEAEAVVLEMTIDPLDQHAAAVDVLAGGAVHPVAPRLHTLG